MSPWLVLAAFAIEPSAASEDRGAGDARSATASSDTDEPAPRKKGVFSSLRYGIGFVTAVGIGTDGSMFGDNVVAEPVSFELRSFLHPMVAFHTTLNLSRMVYPAIRDGDGRIDYECHLVAHLPAGGNATAVIGPGIQNGYSVTGSRYQRIMGDLRMGVDHRHGNWSIGTYVRPYVGNYREVGEARGQLTGGVIAEIAAIWHVPKKGERAR